MDVNVIEKLKKHERGIVICSKSVNLQSYFTSFRAQISKTFLSRLEFTLKPKTIDQIFIREQNFQKLIPYDFFEKKCSINKLKVDGESPIFEPGKAKAQLGLLCKIPEVGVEKLTSLQHLKLKKKQITRHYRDDNWQTSSIKSGPINLDPLKEHVISIKVYRPFFHNMGETTRCYRPRIQQEIEVLGQHTLDVLRDTITCPNHYAKRGEFSDNPHKRDVPFVKDVYRSGFFFIENVFYNDMRHPENIDYSEVIRDWASKDPDTPYPTLSTSLMETTKFCDLSIRFGYPYVYQHQGGCEHLLVFSNARLINRFDELCSHKYPLHRSVVRFTLRLCIMCSFFAAKWITKNNKRVPHDPAYFCENCFHSYNYKNGVKLCNFTAYPIFESLSFKAKTRDVKTQETN